MRVNSAMANELNFDCKIIQSDVKTVGNHIVKELIQIVVKEFIQIAMSISNERIEPKTVSENPIFRTRFS